MVAVDRWMFVYKVLGDVQGLQGLGGLDNWLPCVHMYVCVCVQSDLTYPHTSIFNELADKVRELDK